MNIFQNYRGEVLNLISFIIWAFFPILSKLTFLHIPSLFTAAWTALFAAVFFIGLVSFQRKWNDFGHPTAWKDILYGSLIIGVLYYALIFWGLKYTSAGNAAIIQLLEIAFTFLLFGLWKKEKHKKTHLFGAFLMLFGAAVVLFPGTIYLHKGDVIILFASVIPPLGNFFQQQARLKISASPIMLGRSVISALFLFLLAFLIEPTPSFSDIQSGFGLLILSGVVLFGIAKVLYIESLAFISVSRAIALTAVGPAFTLLFAYLILNETPKIWQIIGLVPIIIGTYFLTRNTLNPLAQK